MDNDATSKPELTMSEMVEMLGGPKAVSVYFGLRYMSKVTEWCRKDDGRGVVPPQYHAGLLRMADDIGAYEITADAIVHAHDKSLDATVNKDAA